MIPPLVSKVNLFVPGNLAAVVAKVVRELLPVFGHSAANQDKPIRSPGTGSSIRCPSRARRRPS